MACSLSDPREERKPAKPTKASRNAKKGNYGTNLEHSACRQKSPKPTDMPEKSDARVCHPKRLRRWPMLNDGTGMAVVADCLLGDPCTNPEMCDDQRQ